ncbi:alpha/beta fold hydrolase [Steroidobacter flavus]|uniref:Alpha/beta fold hydrolase n=1 Tax=Steroidobacter flavus TaxID=1842136 RepID=A0ABV8T2G9_9GAMM
MKSSILLSRVCLLLWLGSFPALADSTAPAGTPAGTYISVPDTLSAEDLSVPVERGLFFVPENRADAHSRVIAVHFIRFPAARKSAERNRPPVFVLPGGPGAEFNLSWRPALYLFERLRRTRDVVYVSQRGNPKSRGLVANLRVNTPSVGWDVPDSPARERERQRQAVKQAITEWTARGMDLRGYDILNVVDDVHELRAALGYDKIVLRGCSFGSQWSLAYLKRWPGNVDRVLLSGVEPLDYGYDSPQWLWSSFARLAQRAESDPGLRSHMPAGGLLAALKASIDKLEQHPVQVTIEDPEKGEPVRVALGAMELRQVLADQSVYGETRDEEIGYWPRFILEIHSGDYRYLAAKVWQARSRRGDGEALILPLIDNSLGITAARDARLLAEPEARWTGDINSFYHNTRDLTPTRVVGDAFRADGPIQVPVLMLQGDLDWSTPIENARHLAGQIPQGHLIEIEGATHCDEVDVAERQLPQLMDQVYSFIDADFAATSPQKLFSTMPRKVAYQPIRFPPFEGPALYERWLDGKKRGGSKQ